MPAQDGFIEPRSLLLVLIGLCAWTADDEEEEAEVIQGVPEPEMINIPGLGPLPIRRPAGSNPAGMGKRLFLEDHSAHADKRKWP